jgi:hypothetical protein
MESTSYDVEHVLNINVKRRLARLLKQSRQAEVVEDRELPSEQEDNQRLHPVVHLRAEAVALKLATREEEVRSKDEEKQQDASNLLRRLQGS